METLGGIFIPRISRPDLANVYMVGRAGRCGMVCDDRIRAPAGDGRETVRCKEMGVVDYSVGDRPKSSGGEVGRSQKWSLLPVWTSFSPMLHHF